MILFPGRHLMGVLECHQSTAPNKMVELKTHTLCMKIGLNSWLKFKLEFFSWINLKFKSEYYSEINKFRILLRDKQFKSYHPFNTSHISYLKKMKIMSYVFWRVPLLIKLQPEKQVQSSGRWLECLGFHQLGLFWRVPQSNYDQKKKVQSYGHRLQRWIVLAGSSQCFFGGFLHQITNYNRKEKVQLSGLLSPFATHVTFYFYYVCTLNEEINLTQEQYGLKVKHPHEHLKHASP